MRFPVATDASARRCLHENPSMAAARVAPPPCEGPISSGEPTVTGRTDAVRGTIYQPSRRHIDFSVLAPTRLITQTVWPTGDAAHSALLAPFLPDGFCAHWELAGCATREGTAHLQPGRLPGPSVLVTVSARRSASSRPSKSSINRNEALSSGANGIASSSPSYALGPRPGRTFAQHSMTARRQTDRCAAWLCPPCR